MFELILGPMQAGKTSLLREHIFQAVKSHQHVLILIPTCMRVRWQTPSTGNDDSKQQISHTGLSFHIASIDEKQQQTYRHILYLDSLDTNKEPELVKLLLDYPTADCLLDELQFFKDDTATTLFIQRRINAKLKVAASALNLNWKREFFSSVLCCLPLANHVINKRAMCEKCRGKDLANFSKKIEIQVGAKTGQDGSIVDVLAKYEPRCYDCFDLV